MTVVEAAKELEISPALVYALCRVGKLGHYRMGLGRGVVRISVEHIAKYKQDCEADMAGPAGPREKKIGGKTVRVGDPQERYREIKERLKGSK